MTNNTLESVSDYITGYFAYWDGLDFHEVKLTEYQGWSDARDEVEVTHYTSPPEEIKS